VRGCTVSGNGFRGILAKGGSCYLSGNNCHRNGFNGIEINDKDGRGSRVEGNNCSWNQGIGFLIQDGFNNLLVRNNAHQNHEGNYSVPGAAAGQIVQLGNLATIANVSPWANFSA
jgi:parallel beta-helix repeat protein